MRRLTWLTRNSAELLETHSNPGMRPWLIPRPVAEATRLLADRIARLPRWRVAACVPDAGTIVATRRTRVFRFVDDVCLRIEPDGLGGSVARGTSRSRVGRGDFGQNARNLLEIQRALAASGLLAKAD